MRSGLRKIKKILSNFKKDLWKRKLSYSCQMGKWVFSPLIHVLRRSTNPGNSSSWPLHVHRGTNCAKSS